MDTEKIIDLIGEYLLKVNPEKKLELFLTVTSNGKTSLLYDFNTASEVKLLIAALNAVLCTLESAHMESIPFEKFYKIMNNFNKEVKDLIKEIPFIKK